MGLLDLQGANRALDSDHLPLPHAKRYVFVAGTDAFAPLYSDVGKTNTLPNPMLADSSGRFGLCYLIEGTYRVVIENEAGVETFCANNVQIGANGASGFLRGFRTVSDLQSDETMSYPTTTQTLEARVGDVIAVTEGSHAYRVAAESAEDYDLKTVGGVKLYVLASERGYNVKAFGAAGDGIKDDAVAIQTAVNHYNTVFLPAGTYKVVCATGSPFTYANGTTPVHCGIDINKSNLSLIGDNAEIDLYCHDQSGTEEINYALSTQKNTMLGAIHNLRIEGLNFEFNPVGKNGDNYRSMHIVGVKDVTIKNCNFYSTGARAGATITLQNCSHVQMSDMRFDNVTQGLNLSYVDNLLMSDMHFDTFVEAIDFDRVVTHFSCQNIHFTDTSGGRSGQCWDFNSCQYGNVSNVSFEHCSNAFLVNFKSTTQPTYLGYLNNDAVAGYTVSRNITFNGMKIRDAAPGGQAIFIGSDHNTDPGMVVHDITMRDVHIQNSGFTEIRMARDVGFDGVVCENPIGSVNSGWAIFYWLKGARTNSELSGWMRNVRIADIQNATDGIRVSEPSHFRIDSFEIENYPQDALEITSVPAGATISIRNGRFLRTVDTVTTGKAVNFPSNVHSNVSVDWENIAITQYTQPVSVAAGNFAFALPKRTYSLGALDTTNGTQYISLYQDGVRSAYFAQVRYSCAVDLAAASNCTGTSIRNSGAAVCSGSTSAGMSGDSLHLSGFTPPEALAVVEPGDSMYFKGAAIGAGQVIDGFAVHCNVLEYLTL